MILGGKMPFGLLNIGLAILVIIGVFWYQNNKIDNLTGENAVLSLQLENSVVANKELATTLENVDNNYSKQLETLNSSLTKKDIAIKEIDRLKRKVKDEDNSAINTANDILHRLQLSTKSNN